MIQAYNLQPRMCRKYTTISVRMSAQFFLKLEYTGAIFNQDNVNIKNLKNIYLHLLDMQAFSMIAECFYFHSNLVKELQ